ncbi:CopG family transcriptional regulator [Candidatus Woesearchaeota archaeon]|nr:CopG family transcriptional regulator [Candidatus Woesearchaeota archaeon]
MAKRVAVSLDEEQIRLLHSIKGFGKKEAEIVKNILLAYLSEKGYTAKFNIKNAKKKT